MVKDAEAHAEDDRRQREVVEARNEAENAAYQAERQVNEMGDTLDTGSKEEIEAAIKDLRENLESEDVELLRQKTLAVQEAFHKVSEQMYAAAQQQAAAGGNGATAEGEGADTDASAMARMKRTVVERLASSQRRNPQPQTSGQSLT